ncbi:hypothetical protein [Streptomyces sp. NPDC088736]|uniref:hypothetical protein n=1 Tax=Streptomyces sp. NPDC088736 TaxID=3365881 RepID=UPI0038289AAF
MEATTKQIGDVPCWRFRLQRADGGHHMHTEPKAALDYRAAEYGLDPTDVDTLLEVLLHEPHLAMTEETETRPARLAGSGPTLWTAENTEAARAAHLARVRSSPVRIVVKGTAALDPVRRGHRPDQARIRATREAVDTNRWLHQYGGFPVQPNFEEGPRA